MWEYSVKYLNHFVDYHKLTSKSLVKSIIIYGKSKICYPYIRYCQIGKLISTYARPSLTAPFVEILLERQTPYPVNSTKAKINNTSPEKEICPNPPLDIKWDTFEATEMMRKK